MAHVAVGGGAVLPDLYSGLRKPGRRRGPKTRSRHQHRHVLAALCRRELEGAPRRASDLLAGRWHGAAGGSNRRGAGVPLVADGWPRVSGPGALTRGEELTDRRGAADSRFDRRGRAHFPDRAGHDGLAAPRRSPSGRPYGSRYGGKAPVVIEHVTVSDRCVPLKDDTGELVVAKRPATDARD